MKISRNKAVDLIANTKNIFGATHIKRTNKEIRVGSYKLGVTKGTNGNGLKYNPSSKNLIPVYDMNKGFRMLDIDGLIELKIDHETYQVE
tara:strand:- start:1088 stop:1357 length:270 start_codon:yes stop_codon:yes gene_type:complete